MNKKDRDYLMDAYNLENSLMFKFEEKEDLLDIENFSTYKVPGNIKSLSRDYEMIENIDKNVWNGEIKSLHDFSFEKKEIRFIKSDYYTFLSINQNMENKLDNKRRDLIKEGDLSLSNIIGVTSCLILDGDDGKKCLYGRRKDTSCNDGYLSVFPSGSLDYNHDCLKNCVEDEFKEELLEYNNDLLENLDYDIYYTGFSVNSINCSPSFSTIIHLKDDNVRYFLNNIKCNKEVDKYYISDFDTALNRFNVYNSSPSGYYTLKRANQVKDKI